jgi:uncharacterized protein YciI
MRRAPLAAVVALVVAASGPAPARGADKPFEMESVQLVLLLRAPTWKKLPAEEAEALQRRHIAHLEAMGKAGNIVVAGPLSEQADPSYRGVCVYRVGSVEEARRLAEQDPAVQAGQLRVEAMTWWFGKGHMAFPKAVERTPERKAAP